MLSLFSMDFCSPCDFVVSSTTPQTLLAGVHIRYLQGSSHNCQLISQKKFHKKDGTGKKNSKWFVTTLRIS